jgi:CubicO group peptidase (beta-lactamase class C family)
MTRRSMIGTVAAVSATARLAAPAALFPRRALGAATYPGATWPSATPESVGLRLAKLLEAQNYALRWGGAGCVIRHGKLAYTWGSFTERYPIHSATKSWGSVVLGWALDDGKVALGDRVQKHLPNLGHKPSTNAGTGWLDDITFDHLATHTGGFEEQSGYGKLLAQPGTRWIYSNGGTNWLANALTNVYAEDLRQLTQRRLFTPLGLTGNEIRWRTPAIYFKDLVYGRPATEFNGGMSASVNAMARLGFLFLHGGNWDGRQVLSGSFVKLATGAAYPRINVGTLRGIGLLWWPNAGGRVAGVPRDEYHSLGKNDNLTIVVPSLDLVAVRVGRDGWRNHGGKLDPFLKPIVDAVVS